MSEEPKSIWKKSLQGWGWLFAWLVLMAACFLISLTVLLLPPGKSDFPRLAVWSAMMSVAVATMIIGPWAFLRWGCCWKNFRRFMFVCACLATLIAICYAEEDWRGWHDLQKFKSQWEAKGESFDWASVVPPTVPDDQNFAMAPIWVESVKAMLGPKNSLQWFGNYAEDGRTNFVNRLNMLVTANDDWPTNGNWQKATLTDLGAWQNYYRTLAARTNMFPVPRQPQTPAQDALLALSKYDSTVEELRQAGERPYSRFPLAYNMDNAWEILLPHLAMLKQCSRILELRAVAELQNGQSDKALADIKLSFRLIDSIRTEPFLISQLVRLAVLQITLQPVYEGLAERQWSDAQLAEIDSELGKLDFLADYQVAIRGERGLEISAIKIFLHPDRHKISEFMGDNGQPQSILVPLLFYHSIPSGWLYQTELRICRFSVTQYLPMIDEASRTVSPASVRSVQKAYGKEMSHRTPENFLEPMLLPSFANVTKKFAYAQESTDLARVAVALERYRLAMGTYPGSLDVLAPHFIDTVPNDIIGGDPLHYQRTSDGRFILYSIGWNGKDDGGTVVYSAGSSHDVNNDLGDWVWRYPASN